MSKPRNGGMGRANGAHHAIAFQRTAAIYGTT